MPVDLSQVRSMLLWRIDLLLEALADTYYMEEEDKQRALLKQMKEAISKLEKGGNNYGPFIKF